MEQRQKQKNGKWSDCVIEKEKLGSVVHNFTVVSYQVRADVVGSRAAAAGRSYSPAVRLTKLTMSDEGGACSTLSDVLECSGDTLTAA